MAGFSNRGCVEFGSFLYATTIDLQVQENPVSNDFHIKLDADSLFLI
jgi:hypothetical protein